MEDIFFDYTKDYNFTENLEDWKMIVGMAGENIFLSNHKPYRITPGSVLLIKPYAYAFPVHRDDTFQFRCYTFQQINCAVLHAIARRTYIQLPKKIVEKHCTLLHILAACTETENLLRKTNPPILPPSIQKALSELQTELPHSVKAWATKIGISDKTLESHFKRTLNILPGHYLRNAKYCYYTAKKSLVRRKKYCYNIEKFS